ncbi:MAG: ATPase, T2SS/T4P/T4SS family [Nitrospirales bacterium]|nr:Flp pilus assembly complex ATPase component TadA [Nitrospirales bacterium]
MPSRHHLGHWPDRSGKTTTLYNALRHVNAKELSVFTLEDPIEYQMPMIRQTQVNPEIGTTFAAGLRALSGQDPDVILVGEIRDQETADLAMRAALTGHLVFSTLHTNDALGAIPRLIDMGVEPFLLASALTAVIGQRSVRCICHDCKIERPQTHTILSESGSKFPQRWTIPDNYGEEDVAPAVRPASRGAWEFTKLFILPNPRMPQSSMVQIWPESGRLSKDGRPTMFREICLNKALRV